MKVLPGFLLLAAAPAVAAPATEVERYYLGDYAVRIAEGDRPTPCRVSIRWADDVGGQFSARSCDRWPDLAAGARWSFDAPSGEARFFDALRQPRFRVRETDAGFIARLSDGTDLWLQALPKPGKRKTR